MTRKTTDLDTIQPTEDTPAALLAAASDGTLWLMPLDLNQINPFNAWQQIPELPQPPEDVEEQPRPVGFQRFALQQEP